MQNILKIENVRYIPDLAESKMQYWVQMMFVWMRFLLIQLSFRMSILVLIPI
jgi:hypothetical protein